MEPPGFIKKIAFYLFARPFVAGETADNALKKAKELKTRGVYAVVNILGEHVVSQEEAGKFFYQYSQLIKRLAQESLDGIHVSVKPSQLGVHISTYLYLKYLAILLRQMQVALPNSFLEIDREDHAHTEDVRKTALVLAKDFHNLRVACQMNLNETPDEIKQFTNAGISVRLCKGTAYPGDIKDEKKIRGAYREQARLLARYGNRPAIATHDLYLIKKLARLKYPDHVEFQVLLGIENEEMFKLADSGVKVGFYVPFGPNWYPYGKRRWKSIVKIFWRNFWYRLFYSR